MTLSESLVELLGRPVRPDDRRRATLHLLDWIGCAGAALVSRQAEIGRAWAPRARAGVALMGGGRAQPHDAAYVNGLLGNVLEMDDVHRQAILHPGPTIMPAALSAAYESGADAEALLDAVVRGYEAVIRIGRSLGKAHYSKFHNTATAGPFGAAAAAGALFGLDKDALVSALANAGTVSGGLWQCRREDVMTKQLHTAHAAQTGYMAARLARDGFTGPKTLLDGEQGFFAALCADGDLSRVLADPNGPWLMHEVSFKPWAACRHAHPTIDAVRELKGFCEPDAIASLTIESYDDAIVFCDRPEPRTTAQAKFSLQHSAAVAFLRDAPTLADFDALAIEDPAVASLRARVSVRAAEPYRSAYPAHFGASATLRRADGQTRTARMPDALGDTENPLADAAIRLKAAQLLAAGGFSNEQGARLAERTLALASGGHLADLIDAIAETSPLAGANDR